MTVSQPVAGASVLTRVMARVAVIALSLTALAWLPANLAMPLGRDQGIFAWVVLQGGIPYVDAWEHKGPAAHYLFKLAMAVFGETTIGIRLFDLVVMGATTVALSWIVRPRGTVAWGLIAGLLIFAQFSGDFSASAQPDGWVSCGALVATALVWQERTRASAFAAAGVGVLLGLAVLVKPNYALLGVVPLVGYAWRDRSGRRHLVNVLWCALGAAAVAAAMAVPFVLPGQLEAVWEVLVVFNLESHATSRPLALRTLIESLWDPQQNAFALWLIHAMAVLGFAGLWRRDRRGAVLLAIGWLAGWAVGVSQNKGFHYQFMPMYVFAAALAADVLAGAMTAEASSVGQARMQSIAAALAILLVPAQQPAHLAYAWWSYVAGARTTADHEAYYCEDLAKHGFCHRDIRAAATFLRGNLRPDETMYLWGFDALLYFEAGRHSPTRFGFNYPMVAGSPRHAEAARREVIAALAARPPKAIVVQEKDRTPITPGSRAALGSFPELAALIVRDYREAYANDNFTVYLRR